MRVGQGVYININVENVDTSKYCQDNTSKRFLVTILHIKKSSLCGYAFRRHSRGVVVRLYNGNLSLWLTNQLCGVLVLKPYLLNNSSSLRYLREGTFRLGYLAKSRPLQNSIVLCQNL